MAQWNQVAQVGFIKPFFSSTTASPLLLFHPPVPILPTDPNFNLLSLSLSSIFRPPRRIFPFDVAPPSLLLSMLTCHWPLSTSFMNLSPITYPVNLYSWYSWSGGAPLLSIEAEIDSRFFFQGIEPRLSRPAKYPKLDEREEVGNGGWGHHETGDMSGMEGWNTGRVKMWEMGNKWFVNGNWKRNGTRERCDNVRKNKTIFGY